MTFLVDFLFLDLLAAGLERASSLAALGGRGRSLAWGRLRGTVGSGLEGGERERTEWRKDNDGKMKEERIVNEKIDMSRRLCGMGKKAHAPKPTRTGSCRCRPVTFRPEKQVHVLLCCCSCCRHRRRRRRRRRLRRFAFTCRRLLLRRRRDL